MTFAALSDNAVVAIAAVVLIACIPLFFYIRRSIIRSGHQPTYFGFRRASEKPSKRPDP